MPEYLLADIGSTFTKLCLVETRSAQVRAQAMAPTTIQSGVNEGFDAALGRLGRPVENVEAALVCSSAAGGLRIAAVGLVPELTLEAARMAALGAGAKVVRAFAYGLAREDVADLAQLKPDIILLSGGTDGGNTRCILENAARIRDHLPGTPVIVAGNRGAYDQLRAVFAGRDNVFFTRNVMPEMNRLDLEPAREVIQKVFLERIVMAKGLDQLRSRARVLMPTPVAVFQAVSLLSQGLPGQEGWGELLAVDIGGATTDVYSCSDGAPRSPSTVLKGLPEPFVKRTVEADIGMRHTLKYLLEQAPAETWAAGSGLDPDRVHAWARAVQENPGRVPQDQQERAVDAALARAGCDIAIRRHCGTLRETYTPQGRVCVQEGKDLAGARCVIGSGGPLAASPDPLPILGAALRGADAFCLKPVSPAFFLDRRYILWAAGLLAQADPGAALALAKKSLVPLA